MKTKQCVAETVCSRNSVKFTTAFNSPQQSNEPAIKRAGKQTSRPSNYDVGLAGRAGRLSSTTPFTLGSSKIPSTTIHAWINIMVAPNQNKVG